MLVGGTLIDYPCDAPISGTGTALDGIYRDREFISDIDEEGDEYRWEDAVLQKSSEPRLPE